MGQKVKNLQEFLSELVESVNTLRMVRNVLKTNSRKKLAFVQVDNS